MYVDPWALFIAAGVLVALTAPVTPVVPSRPAAPVEYRYGKLRNAMSGLFAWAVMLTIFVGVPVLLLAIH